MLANSRNPTSWCDAPCHCCEPRTGQELNMCLNTLRIAEPLRHRYSCTNGMRPSGSHPTSLHSRLTMTHR
eukprot:511523-Pleurochrysis_carterae.AAC.1